MRHWMHISRPYTHVQVSQVNLKSRAPLRFAHLKPDLPYFPFLCFPLTLFPTTCVFFSQNKNKNKETKNKNMFVSWTKSVGIEIYFHTLMNIFVSFGFLNWTWTLILRNFSLFFTHVTIKKITMFLGKQSFLYGLFESQDAFVAFYTIFVAYHFFSQLLLQT